MYTAALARQRQLFIRRSFKNTSECGGGARGAHQRPPFCSSHPMFHIYGGDANELNGIHFNINPLSGFSRKKAADSFKCTR